MWEGAARDPKFLSRYLTKTEAPFDVYPNFSFRQLPPASVSFRGIPRTSVSAYIVGTQTTTYAGAGTEDNVPGPKFT